ncbi:MAG: LacI family DNA-binding transcriptional regulator [Cyclobacteriaceae bacterium]
MSNHSVTIKDIARILGISKSTVSRALSEHTDVNAKTREKVLALATKLRYQPNSIALHLKQQRTNTIGVIIPETVNTFFSGAVSGIQKIATLAGFQVVVCQSNECYTTEKDNLHSLIATRVDGLLISVSRETENTDHFDTLLQNNIPVVFFDRICEKLDTSQVFTDNYQIAFEATQHLIDQGCRRIATIAGPSHLYTSCKRFEGYKDALMKNNIEFNPDYLIYADFKQESIERFTRRLINLKESPDAIFAINDMTAIEMMHVIKKNGLRIPQDIAVLGFNNDKIGQFVEPSLTTIDMPAQDMGEAAAELLLFHIKNPNQRPEKRLINSRLIVRDSTRLRP